MNHRRRNWFANRQQHASKRLGSQPPYLYNHTAKHFKRDECANSPPRARLQALVFNRQHSVNKYQWHSNIQVLLGESIIATHLSTAG